jgi:hypothetical protein
MRAMVAAHLSGLRPTTTTDAPMRASSRAVTSPIPEEAPVTIQVFPVISVIVFYPICLRSNPWVYTLTNPLGARLLMQDVF